MPDDDPGKARGRRVFLRRLHRHPQGEETTGEGPAVSRDEEFIEIDPGALTGVFATPGWLRDLGMTAWLLVGVGLLLAGSIWLLTLTETIVGPVIAGAVVAVVAAPVVAWLASHRVPRPVGALLLLVGVIVVSAGVAVLVLAGIASQTGDVTSHLADAKQTLAGWLADLGVDPSKAKSAIEDGGSTSTDSVNSLLNGVAAGLKTLSSLAFFLSLTALCLIFLLIDGPKIRSWGERHMGVPLPVARIVSTRSIAALRGYFVGVTIVAAFNGVVVALGALLLGVPLAGTLFVVTFFAAYVPYLGAWTAGAFSVLLALGGAGTEAAVGMIVVQLLANGVLQQAVQPFALGAALGIHPLAVLIVTIGGGALFGSVGLILAAPVVSAVTRISADLSRAREASPEEGEGGASMPSPADAPAT